MFPPKDNGGKSRWSEVGELTSLAMTLAFCVIFGLLGGQWVGRKLGHEDAGVAVGVFIGIFAAGYELVRVAKRFGRDATPPEKSDDDEDTRR